MLRPIFRSFQRVARGSRAFASSSDDSNNYVEKKINSVHDKDAVDEKTLKSAAEASRALHPTDKEAQKKSLKSLIGRLKESSFESSQVSQQGILEEIADTMKNVQVEQQPVTTGKITNPLHMKRAKIAIRHEVFEEALMRGIPEKEARELAEKATTFAEERLKNPLTPEPIKYKAEKPASEVKSEKQKDMSKHVEDLFQKALDIFDKTFNETDHRSWPGIASSKPVIPDPSTSTLFDVFDAEHDLKIFTNPSLKTHELAFWKQYDYDRARIVNKALGPNNAFEEMIQWTEEGKMWPYPINNEYQLGEELNVPFTEHIFLEKYLDKYNLPKTGPIAQFMELVSVGLSKNPYMTAEKKRNHMEWFANYFNREQIERVHFLHEKEQSVLVEET